MDAYTIKPDNDNLLNMMKNLHTELSVDDAFEIDLTRRGLRVHKWDDSLLVEFTSRSGDDTAESGCVDACWLDSGHSVLHVDDAMKMEEMYRKGTCYRSHIRASGSDILTVKMQIVMKWIGEKLGGDFQAQAAMMEMVKLSSKKRMKPVVKAYDSMYVGGEYLLLKSQIRAIRVKYGHPTIEDWEGLISRIPQHHDKFIVLLQ